jgi:hypothetical protein
MTRSRAFIEKIKYLSNYYFGYTDYFSFPFDTTQALNRVGSAVALKKGCEILESFNINYTLATGTALGIHRENGFIGGDNDLDVDIVEQKISNNRLLQLCKVFKEKGFKIGRKVTFRGSIQQLIFYSKSNVIFDVCIWRKKDNFFYNYLPELVFKVRRHPAQYYTNMSEIDFSDQKYPVPKDIESWLVLQYGEDWRIPKSKGNWVEDALDITPNKDFIYRTFLFLKKIIR